jgi:RNA polymerase sigma factor (sigma-70 family)
VYRSERDGLVRLAYLTTGSRQVAEDLVQDCFIRVMAKLDPSDRPGAYLRRSVLNACYSWHRRARREVGTGDPGEHADGSDGPPAFVAPGEGSDPELWDALDRLTPRRRTVLVMRFYLDMSEAEVAATLGCRAGTVKSSTSRALAELRRLVAR